MARRRAQATVEFRLVESREKALTVVRQIPEPGDELREPRVIKVEIASRPWIGFLPGIYQDADEEHADFLQRFLLISAHLTSGVEENLEFVHEVFDPRLTEARWLPWLASWLAMPLLEGWDEEKRREIIRRTPELYRERGTAEGLKLALRLFADVQAEIHEGEWPYPGMVIGKSSSQLLHDRPDGAIRPVGRFDRVVTGFQAHLLHGGGQGRGADLRDRGERREGEGSHTRPER